MTDEASPVGPDEGGQRSGLAGAIAGSVGAAALGLVLAGPLGAAGAAMVSAGSGPLFTYLAQLDLRRRERVVHVLDAAREKAGSTEDEMAGWAAADPAHADLLTAVVEGAYRTGEQYTAKIKVMADALADGVLSDDPAVLDHSLLVTQALGALDRPHLVALRGLVEEEDEPGEWRHLVLPWAEWCEQVSQYSEASMTRLEASLTREGLLEVYTYPVDNVDDPALPEDAHQGKHYAVSDFGFDILHRLQEVSEQHKSDQENAPAT